MSRQEGRGGGDSNIWPQPQRCTASVYIWAPQTVLSSEKKCADHPLWPDLRSCAEDVLHSSGLGTLSQCPHFSVFFSRSAPCLWASFRMLPSFRDPA